MVAFASPISPQISSPSELLVMAVYVLVAAIVTVHVLLSKRDVRAALGWIGMAWLSPLLGGILYYVFGINRVTRRALALDRLERERGDPACASACPVVSAHIARLADVGTRVLGSPLLAGNGVSLLEGGDEAYASMLAAIAGAGRSVALASYIFRDDPVGRSFTDALIAAHRRGVVVRVLLDSIGSGYFRPRTLGRLRAAGVPVGRFLHTWVPWRMPFLNMRNHKKILVVDGSIGFTGGLNIGAENCTRADVRKRVDDVHVRLAGPAVRQLMDSFARDWSFTTGEVLGAEVWWPPLVPEGASFARGIRSGPDADIDKLESILGAALDAALERVRIVTPYFLPDERLLFAIAQAALRGVMVEIVIPAHTDYFFLDWAMRAHLRFFEGAPAGIYLSPPPFDHAKLMTVDGQWCLVGSSNWDARSLRLNFEFDLECFDPVLVGKVDRVIDRRIARSARLDPAALRSAPKWSRIRDAMARLLLPYL